MTNNIICDWQGEEGWGGTKLCSAPCNVPSSSIFIHYFAMMIVVVISSIIPISNAFVCWFCNLLWIIYLLCTELHFYFICLYMVCINLRHLIDLCHWRVWKVCEIKISLFISSYSYLWLRCVFPSTYHQASVQYIVLKPTRIKLRNMRRQWWAQEWTCSFSGHIIWLGKK